MNNNLYDNKVVSDLIRLGIKVHHYSILAYYYDDKTPLHMDHDFYGLDDRDQGIDDDCNCVYLNGHYIEKQCAGRHSLILIRIQN